MKLTIDLTDSNEVQEAINFLENLGDKQEKPAKTTKPKKVKNVEEEKIEVEDDNDLFVEEDYTEADVKKALMAYAKENSKADAKKIVKQYSVSGKVADIDESDYAAVIAELV